MKPSEILNIELSKKCPFCCMFGCYELEFVAKNILKWLSENGDNWDLILPDLSQFGSDRELQHTHWCGENYYICNFINDFTYNNVVNDKFIKWVHRERL